MTTPLRIVWMSNAPFCPSGYGKQTLYALNSLKELKQRGAPIEDVALCANYGIQTGRFDMGDLRVYGSASGQDMYGNGAAKVAMEDFEGNLLVTLYDAFVMDSNFGNYGYLWAPWFPVDHDPMPPQVRGHLQSAQFPLAMSEFGLGKAQELNLEKARYLPHCTMTEVYAPRPELKRAAKEKLGVDPDGFLFGMVANNVEQAYSRKGYAQALEAFQRVIAEVPGQTDLFMLSRPRPANGMDLVTLGQMFMVEERVMYPSDHSMATLFNHDKGMALFYNALDCLIMPSTGEGFGVPLIEAQASGVPVITHDCTSMTEVLGPDAGILLPRGAPYWTDQNSFRFMPDVKALADAMVEVAMLTDVERTQMGAAGRAHVEANYKREDVRDRYWEPLLNEMADAIDAELTEAAEEEMALAGGAG